MTFSVQAEGEFIVIRSPPSVKFEGDEPIDQNLIPDICSASLGFTTKQVKITSIPLSLYISKVIGKRYLVYVYFGLCCSPWWLDGQKHYYDCTLGIKN